MKVEQPSQKRQLARIAIERSGQLRHGSTIAPCQVLDVTEKGFRLRLEGSYARGDVLHLEFPLTQEQVLACTVEVRYVLPPFLGVVIVGISCDHQKTLSKFIDEVLMLNSRGF